MGAFRHRHLYGPGASANIELMLSGILDSVHLPQFYTVRRKEQDLVGVNYVQELNRQLDSFLASSPSVKSKRIALAVGSRGIYDLPGLVSACINRLKTAGADVFIVPAMGSHGGACASGQTEVLESLGVTEGSAGVPIISSMETVRIGTTPTGIPVRIDRAAADSDGIILLNRVKPHTSFSGLIESGLVKMSVIGLGNRDGADICHRFGYEQMADRLVEIGRHIIASGKILCGIAVIENHLPAIESIHLVPGGSIPDKEPGLLVKADKLVPRLPFRKLDVLVVDNIGKDISGTGMDLKTIGRCAGRDGKMITEVTRICVLDLTDASRGNANGIGMADFTTERLRRKTDPLRMWPNALTTNMPGNVRMPMALQDDLSAIKAAVKTCAASDPSAVRIARIINTSNLDRIEISEALVEELLSGGEYSIDGEPHPLKFKTQSR